MPTKLNGIRSIAIQKLVICMHVQYVNLRRTGTIAMIHYSLQNDALVM